MSRDSTHRDGGPQSSFTLSVTKPSEHESVFMRKLPTMDFYCNSTDGKYDLESLCLSQGGPPRITSGSTRGKSQPRGKDKIVWSKISVGDILEQTPAYGESGGPQVINRLIREQVVPLVDRFDSRTSRPSDVDKGTASLMLVNAEKFARPEYITDWERPRAHSLQDHMSRVDTIRASYSSAQNTSEFAQLDLRLLKLEREAYHYARKRSDHALAACGGTELGIDLMTTVLKGKIPPMRSDQFEKRKTKEDYDTAVQEYREQSSLAQNSENIIRGLIDTHCTGDEKSKTYIADTLLAETTRNKLPPLKNNKNWPSLVARYQALGTAASKVKNAKTSSGKVSTGPSSGLGSRAESSQKITAHSRDKNNQPSQTAKRGAPPASPETGSQTSVPLSTGVDDMTNTAQEEEEGNLEYLRGNPYAALNENYEYFLSQESEKWKGGKDSEFEKGWRAFLKAHSKPRVGPKPVRTEAESIKAVHDGIHREARLKRKYVYQVINGSLNEREKTLQDMSDTSGYRRAILDTGHSYQQLENAPQTVSLRDFPFREKSSGRASSKRLLLESGDHFDQVSIINLL
jgi:hypothetical protein